MLHTTLAASLALAPPAAALLAPSPALAQASAAIASGKVKPSALSPGEIVAAAPASEWVAIAPSDLLVMTLAPDRDGNKRQAVIQLMPPPFSQGWIGNIRKLAAAHWWDGLSINRVQDNYVVQWGDAEAEDKAKAKALPNGVQTIGEDEYTSTNIGVTEVWMASMDKIEIERLLAGQERSPIHQIRKRIASVFENRSLFRSFAIRLRLAPRAGRRQSRVQGMARPLLRDGRRGGVIYRPTPARARSSTP